MLGRLFDRVMIPMTVYNELRHAHAPAAVQSWAAAPPPWLSVQEVARADLDAIDARLDEGERAVVALALKLRPDLVLLDDRAGVSVAQALGFAATGTLGLLVRGAQRQLLDLDTVFAALGKTNFHWTATLRADVIARYRNTPPP